MSIDEAPPSGEFSDMAPVAYTDMKGMGNDERSLLPTTLTAISGKEERKEVDILSRAGGDIPHSNDAALDTIERVSGDEALGTAENDGEMSIESLIGSLLRALKTEQGRLDFKRLVENPHAS